MLAKRTFKNQITIPQEVIKDFPGVDYFDVQSQGKSIVLMPVTVREPDHLYVVRRKMKKLGIQEKDIDDAVAWARRRR